MKPPEEPRGSRAAARFLTALGIDPDHVAADSLTIDILSTHHVQVRWTGVGLYAPDQIEDAMAAAATEPSG